jgi:hypothetical protein
MKRTAAIALLVLSAVAVGFVLGDRSWRRLRFLGGPKAIVPKVPSGLGHFRLTELPPFASGLYYYRDGFTDVDEYLSFVLPPDRASEFLASYLKANSLPAVKDTSTIPRWVLGMASGETWDGRYWFSNLAELDQIYYGKYLFLGYSASKNRFYLMNWNE